MEDVTKLSRSLPFDEQVKADGDGRSGVAALDRVCQRPIAPKLVDCCLLYALEDRDV